MSARPAPAPTVVPVVPVRAPAFPDVVEDAGASPSAAGDATLPVMCVACDATTRTPRSATTWTCGDCGQVHAVRLDRRGGLVSRRAAS